MKIIKDKKINDVNFEDLEIGEVFTDYDDNYFLKIELLTLEGNRYVNATSMSSGECIYFKSYDSIIPVNATLIINED